MKIKNSLLLALLLSFMACQTTKKGLNDTVLYQQY